MSAYIKRINAMPESSPHSRGPRRDVTAQNFRSLHARGYAVARSRPPSAPDGRTLRQDVVRQLGEPTRTYEEGRIVKVDVTTREQVLLLFGEPDAAFQEQRRFIYLWAHVTALLVGVDVAEISKGYMLEIDFRPDGTVCRCEVRTAGLSELFRHQTIAGVGYARRRRDPRRDENSENNCGGVGSARVVAGCVPRRAPGPFRSWVR